MSFNLRAMVREALDNAEVADLDLVTEAVLNSIDPIDYRSALAATLRQYVRLVAGERRTTVDTDALTPRPVDHAPAPRSSHVEAVRRYRGALAMWVHVGGAARKFLGDCARDDLLFAAQERRNLAASNNTAAREFERLAALLNEHDVATVADLPAAVLAVGLVAA